LGAARITVMATASQIRIIFRREKYSIRSYPFRRTSGSVPPSK
jgi:hypothetical protein